MDTTGQIIEIYKDSGYFHSGRPDLTPADIDVLAPMEVFVFGSNLEGHHGGGAARTALRKFRAVYGQGVGLQGPLP